MKAEAFDWNELGWLAEGHKGLVAAKEALKTGYALFENEGGNP